MSEPVDIGSSIEIKGDLIGNEDLTIEGRVEGRIDLKGHQLTIGKKARIAADIRDASVVVVMGKIIGNIAARQKVEIAVTGSVLGDIDAPRLVIADGARFKGRVEMTVVRGTATGSPPPKPGFGA